MRARLLKLAAWLCLGVIVFVTVSPIGLRPSDLMPVNLDRALAFAVMAGLFTAAYPRHWLGILLLTTSGACLIEGLQYLSPTRHAHLADAMYKAAGAAGGVGLVKCLNLLAPRSRNTAGPTLRQDDGLDHDEALDTDEALDAESRNAFSPSVTVLWSSNSSGNGAVSSRNDD